MNGSVEQHLLFQPDALGGEILRVAYLPDQTIEQILGKNVADDFYVQVNSKSVPRQEWGVRRLLEGDHVIVYRRPGGDAFRTIAEIAVVAFASWATAGLAGGPLSGYIAASGGTFFQTLGYYGIEAGITIAGMAAVSAIIPPPQVNTSSSTSSGKTIPGITSGQNSASQYAPLPKLCGTYKYAPPLAAPYYTEIAGNNQYLRVLLCLGYGPLQIDGHTVDGSNTLDQTTALSAGVLTIAGTDAASYGDVEYQIGEMSNITLYSQDVQEQELKISMPIGSTTQTGTVTDGTSQIETTAQNVSEISVDITFPQGMYCMNGQGNVVSGTSVNFKVEYSPAGANTWTAIANPWTVTASTKNTLRKTYRWKVTAGQYDVRVTRVSSQVPADSVVVMNATWSALRGVVASQPWTGPSNAIMLAMRVEASNRISGTLGTVEVLATGMCQVYNTGTLSWSLQATSNPAWWVYDALTNQNLKRPVPSTRIDLTSFTNWAAWCTANSIEYNNIEATQETLMARINRICTTGHAVLNLNGAQFNVVQDDNSGLTPVQLITPYNASSFSVQRTYQKLPHALKVQYIDSNTWQSNTVIAYRTGYSASNATVFESLKTEGVTSHDQAWKEGQYFIRSAILRPETYTVTMGFENLVASRGDLVRLAYDTIEVGVGWGLVKSFTEDGSGNVLTVTLDQPMLADGVSQYAILVRHSDGTQTIANVNTVAGENTELTISSTGSLLIGQIDVGDLVEFGVSGNETILCKIKGIKYNDDLSAQLTLVGAAQTLYNLGTPPVYNAGITPPINITELAPAQPVLDSVYSGSSALYRDTDGSYHVGALVSFHLVSNTVPVQTIEARYWDSSGGPYSTDSAQASDGFVRLKNVETGQTIEVQIRAVTPWGKSSDWTTAVSNTIIGKSGPPSDVGSFTVQQNGDTVVMEWAQVPDLDLQGYEIRYMDQSQPFDYSKANVLTEVTRGTQVTSAKIAPGAWFVGIKAVDTSGNYSTNALVTDVTILNNNNIIFTSNEAPLWAGTKTGFKRNIAATLSITAANWTTVGSGITLSNPSNDIFVNGGLAGSGAKQAFSPAVGRNCVFEVATYRSSGSITTPTNLLTANQAGAETDTSGATTYYTSTITRDTSQFHSGAASFKCTTDFTAHTASGIILDPTATTAIPSGTTVAQVGSWVLFPKGQKFAYGLRFAASGGAYTGEKSDVFYGTGSWQYVTTLTENIPANTTNVGVECYAVGYVGDKSIDFWVDDSFVYADNTNIDRVALVNSAGSDNGYSLAIDQTASQPSAFIMRDSDNTVLGCVDISQNYPNTWVFWQLAIYDDTPGTIELYGTTGAGVNILPTNSAGKDCVSGADTEITVVDTVRVRSEGDTAILSQGTVTPVVYDGTLVLDGTGVQASYVANYLDAGFVDKVRAWATITATAPAGQLAQPTMQIRWAQAASGTANMWTDVNVSGEALGSGDGTTTAFSGNFANGDVDAATVTITDGNETFTDTQTGEDSGTLVGSLGGTGSITYSTGAYSITFNTAPASGASITGSYTYDNTSMYSGNNLMWQTWGDWQDWTIGLVEAQTVDFQFLYDPANGSPVISQFTPVVDTLPRNEGGSGVFVPAAGKTITFSKQFHGIPTITLTAQGATPIFALHSNETTTDFFVQCFDTSGTAVEGTIDWRAFTE